MAKDYNPDIVSVVDEEGKEHIFEELDRIETADAMSRCCPYMTTAKKFSKARTRSSPSRSLRRTAKHI